MKSKHILLVSALVITSIFLGFGSISLAFAASAANNAEVVNPNQNFFANFYETYSVPFYADGLMSENVEFRGWTTVDEFYAFSNGGVVFDQYRSAAISGNNLEYRGWSTVEEFYAYTNGGIVFEQPQMATPDPALYSDFYAAYGAPFNGANLLNGDSEFLGWSTLEEFYASYYGDVEFFSGLAFD